MTTIELFAKDEVLELVKSPTVSSGDVNAVDMHIKFSEEWKDYAKVAVFFRDMDNLQEPLERLLQDGMCKVPGEVIKDHVPFYIGIRGAKDDSLKTTDIVKYSVIKGVPEIIKAPSVDIYQQILAGYAKLEDIKEIAIEASNKAEIAAEEAENSLVAIPGKIEAAKEEIDKYVQGKEETLKGDTGNVYFAAFKVVNGKLKMYSNPAFDKVKFKRQGNRLKYRLAI